MTSQGTRIRSMKARRKSTCRCGRLILVGNRITLLGGAWLCLDCALTTRKASGTAARTTP